MSHNQGYPPQGYGGQQPPQYQYGAQPQQMSGGIHPQGQPQAQMTVDPSTGMSYDNSMYNQQRGGMYQQQQLQPGYQQAYQQPQHYSYPPQTQQNQPMNTSSDQYPSGGYQSTQGHPQVPQNTTSSQPVYSATTTPGSYGSSAPPHGQSYYQQPPTGPIPQANSTAPYDYEYDSYDYSSSATLSTMTPAAPYSHSYSSGGSDSSMIYPRVTQNQSIYSDGNNSVGSMDQLPYDTLGYGQPSSHIQNQAQTQRGGSNSGGGSGSMSASAHSQIAYSSHAQPTAGIIPSDGIYGGYNPIDTTPQGMTQDHRTYPGSFTTSATTGIASINTPGYDSYTTIPPTSSISSSSHGRPLSGYPQSTYDSVSSSLLSPTSIGPGGLDGSIQMQGYSAQNPNLNENQNTNMYPTDPYFSATGLGITQSPRTSSTSYAASSDFGVSSALQPTQTASPYLDAPFSSTSTSFGSSSSALITNSTQASIRPAGNTGNTTSLSSTYIPQQATYTHHSATSNLTSSGADIPTQSHQPQHPSTSTEQTGGGEGKAKTGNGGQRKEETTGAVVSLRATQQQPSSRLSSVPSSLPPPHGLNQQQMRRFLLVLSQNSNSLREHKALLLELNRVIWVHKAQVIDYVESFVRHQAMLVAHPLYSMTTTTENTKSATKYDSSPDASSILQAFELTQKSAEEYTRLVRLGEAKLVEKRVALTATFTILLGLRKRLKYTSLLLPQTTLNAFRIVADFQRSLSGFNLKYPAAASATTSALPHPEALNHITFSRDFAAAARIHFWFSGGQTRLSSAGNSQVLLRDYSIHNALSTGTLSLTPSLVNADSYGPSVYSNSGHQKAYAGGLLQLYGQGIPALFHTPLTLTHSQNPIRVNFVGGQMDYTHALPIPIRTIAATPGLSRYFSCLENQRGKARCRPLISKTGTKLETSSSRGIPFESIFEKKYLQKGMESRIAFRSALESSQGQPVPPIKYDYTSEMPSTRSLFWFELREKELSYRKTIQMHIQSSKKSRADRLAKKAKKQSPLGKKEAEKGEGEAEKEGETDIHLKQEHGDAQDTLSDAATNTTVPTDALSTGDITSQSSTGTSLGDEVGHIESVRDPPSFITQSNLSGTAHLSLHAAQTFHRLSSQALPSILSPLLRHANRLRSYFNGFDTRALLQALELQHRETLVRAQIQAQSTTRSVAKKALHDLSLVLAQDSLVAFHSSLLGTRIPATYSYLGACVTSFSSLLYHSVFDNIYTHSYYFLKHPREQEREKKTSGYVPREKFITKRTPIHSIHVVPGAEQNCLKTTTDLHSAYPVTLGFAAVVPYRWAFVVRFSPLSSRHVCGPLEKLSKASMFANMSTSLDDDSMEILDREMFSLMRHAQIICVSATSPAGAGAAYAIGGSLEENDRNMGPGGANTFLLSGGSSSAEMLGGRTVEEILLGNIDTISPAGHSVVSSSSGIFAKMTAYANETFHAALGKCFALRKTRSHSTSNQRKEVLGTSSYQLHPAFEALFVTFSMVYKQFGSSFDAFSVTHAPREHQRGVLKSRYHGDKPVANEVLVKQQVVGTVEDLVPIKLPSIQATVNMLLQMNGLDRIHEKDNGPLSSYSIYN